MHCYLGKKVDFPIITLNKQDRIIKINQLNGLNSVFFFKTVHQFGPLWSKLLRITPGISCLFPQIRKSKDPLNYFATDIRIYTYATVRVAFALLLH